MFYKISIALISCSFFLQSCYTMSHPEPCPGLVEQNLPTETVIVKSDS